MPIANFRLPLFSKLSIPFVCGAVVILLLTIQSMFARAYISATPHDQYFNVNEVLILGTATSSAETLLPGIILRATETASRTYPVKNIRLEIGRAEGIVIIHNQGAVAQLLVATTRLLAPDGKLYRLIDRVVVPANGIIETRVRADADGPLYNIEPARFTIPGLSEEKQKLIWAESPAPITGGLRELLLISETDINTAHEALITELKTTLTESLKELIPASYAWHPESIAFTEIAFETSGAPGDAVGQFSATMTLAGAVPSLKTEDLLSAVQKATNEQLPSGYVTDLARVSGETVQTEPQPLKLTLTLDRIEDNGAKAVIGVAYEHPLIPDLAVALPDLLGLQKENARDYLNARYELSALEIKLSPPWRTRLPRSPDQIDFLLAHE